MRQFRYKKCSSFFSFAVVIFFFAAFLISSENRVFAQTVGTPCGEPTHQGFCEKIGVCACPGGNTLGKGGVCGQQLECCSQNYPGNANNCPGTAGAALPADGTVNCGAIGFCYLNTCPAGNTINGNDIICKGAAGDGGICCEPPAVATTHAHFQGIGNTINENGTQENANPQHKAITAQLLVASANGTPITNQTNKSTNTANPSQGSVTTLAQPETPTLTYNPQSGLFENPKIIIPNIGIAGQYKLILHVDKYVNRQMQNSPTGLLSLAPGTTTDTGTTEMIPGDIAPAPHGDNIIDIQDYNSIAGCMTKANTAICPNPKAADLNDDGIVDEKDLALLKANFGSVGSSFSTPQFMCAQDPNCLTGSNSLQLCPLQCKIQNVPGQ
jgi:hypothetical protein